MRPTIDDKQRLADKLRADVAAYLSAGGRIDEQAAGVTADPYGQLGINRKKALGVLDQTYATKDAKNHPYRRDQPSRR